MTHRKTRATFLLAATLLLPLTEVRGQSGDPGLVAHWLFTPEHVTDDVAEDLVGDWNGKLGHNVALVREPPCLYFDGKTVKEGDRRLGVTINNKTTSKGLPHAPLTLEAWARFDKPIKWTSLVGFLQDTHDLEYGWYLGTSNWAPARLVFGLASRGNADMNGCIYLLSARTPLRLGHWLHLVGTYDGHLQSIYVDGKLQNQTGRNEGYIDYPPQAPLTVGNYRDDDESHPFHGFIHEVRIYNRALTAEEVDTRFQAKRDLFRDHSEDIQAPDRHPGTIRTWAVSEPFYALETNFQRQFDAVHDPETDPESVHWEVFSMKPNEIMIDLAKRFSGLKFASVYARTYIRVSAEREIRLFISHDDGVKIWLNGTQQLENNSLQGIEAPPSQLTVKLRPGWNQLMIKVVNGIRGWALSVRAVEPDSDQPAEDLEFSATPPE